MIIGAHPYTLLTAVYPSVRIAKWLFSYRTDFSYLIVGKDAATLIILFFFFRSGCRASRQDWWSEDKSCQGLKGNKEATRGKRHRSWHGNLLLLHKRVFLCITEVLVLFQESKLWFCFFVNECQQSFYSSLFSSVVLCLILLYELLEFSPPAALSHVCIGTY